MPRSAPRPTAAAAARALRSLRNELSEAEELCRRGMAVKRPKARKGDPDPMRDLRGAYALLAAIFELGAGLMSMQRDQLQRALLHPTVVDAMVERMVVERSRDRHR